MSKNSIFPRRIKKMQEEVLRTDINDITFMNINKRGGFSYTDMTILNTYAMQFSDNIVQEIEIINPELIICCGIGLKRIINMVYKKCNKNLNKDIIEVHHLSYVVGDDIYMNEFKDKLANLGFLLKDYKYERKDLCNIKIFKTTTQMIKNMLQ